MRHFDSLSSGVSVHLSFVSFLVGDWFFFCLFLHCHYYSELLQLVFLYSSNYNIYYITPCKFLTRALADGLSLESEWQQVTTGFQDSSQYCGRPQQLFIFDGLYSSSDFFLLERVSLALGTIPSAPMTTGFTSTFMFHTYWKHKWTWIFLKTESIYAIMA